MADPRAAARPVDDGAQQVTRIIEIDLSAGRVGNCDQVATRPGERGGVAVAVGSREKLSGAGKERFVGVLVGERVGVIDVLDQRIGRPGGCDVAAAALGEVRGAAVGVNEIDAIGIYDKLIEAGNPPQVPKASRGMPVEDKLCAGEGAVGTLFAMVLDDVQGPVVVPLERLEALTMWTKRTGSPGENPSVS